MQVTNIKTGFLEVNTYIVSAENRSDCIVIDPGDEAGKIIAELEKLKLVPAAVFVTHCHFDHIGAVSELAATGAKVFMSDVSERALHYTVLHGKTQGVSVKSFKTDCVLKDGEEYAVAGLKIKALYTPGHSPTSFCFVIQDAVFSGDTIFAGSFGRCDFRDGDINALKNAVDEKIFTLPETFKIYPGHGDFTTVKTEKNHNPINCVAINFL